MGLKPKAPNVFLAAESLTAGKGGICRVARLMSKVLAEQAQHGEISAQALVLNGAASNGNDIPISTAAGSRLKFCARVHAAALNHSHFIYDFLGIARAHCRVPGLKRRSLAYIHGIEVWEGYPAHYARASRGIDCLVSNSAYTRDRAERVYGGFARAKVCWLATESDVPPAAPAYTSGPPTVFIVGRVDVNRYKGHDELIACWPEVVSAVPDARLVLVGEGRRSEEIKRAAAQSPVSRQIDIRGFVAEEQMDALWSEATLFAMPSRGEGFGLVYIEAMRHGVPVIASIHDAAPEVNLDGQTGYNIDLDRPAELSERVIHLLRNRDCARKLGDRGRARWAEHFSYSAFRRRFVPLLSEFLGGNGSHSA
jgi:phosphatidylinositol alpha-1,6-mannosyltransferase